MTRWWPCGCPRNIAGGHLPGCPDRNEGMKLDSATTVSVPGAGQDGERLCPFCAIVADPSQAADFINDGDVVSFAPLNPVTPGHRLFVPVEHVQHAGEDPGVAGRVFAVAARWLLPGRGAANLITSAGAAATQTVRHLHVHLVPRRPDDGLALPWTVAPDAAADADQRWTRELTAQADRYASVGTEIADAMAEALRTAVRIMHRAPTETRTG